MEDYEIEDLKSNLRNYLESHNINTRRMFRCLNPNHIDKNPSMKYFDDNKVYCYGCGTTYNLFNVISIIENVDNKEAFKRAIQYYQHYKSIPQSAISIKVISKKDSQPKNYDKAYAFWKTKLKSNIEAQDYLLSRGISMNTAEKFNIGFNEFKFKDGNFKSVVIPITSSCFSARNIDKTSDFRHYKPFGCQSDILNKSALTNKLPYCVITEGEFDCLSFDTVGINAISLGGANNLIKFTSADIDKTKTYIIALDNDEAGLKATAELVSYFRDNAIKFTFFDNCGLNDANDALVKNKELFTESIKRMTDEIIKKYRKKQEEM